MVAVYWEAVCRDVHFGRRADDYHIIGIYTVRADFNRNRAAVNEHITFPGVPDVICPNPVTHKSRQNQQAQTLRTVLSFYYKFTTYGEI